MTGSRRVRLRRFRTYAVGPMCWAYLQMFTRPMTACALPRNSLKTDGPSAGIAMTTALVSALTKVPVRGRVAMTGEVSLRGRVLPIGGVKSKLLAAWRRGAHTVLVPRVNEKDLRDLPSEVQEGLEIILVSHMDQVLAQALDWTDGVPEWLRTDAAIWVPPQA